jgi:hypothetical protein
MVEKNDFLSVLIVGCGNLGKRHFQSLLESEEPLNIVLVDPSIESLSECESLESSKSKIHSIKKFTSLAHLPELIDLVIISTNSDVRRDVFIDIINMSDVKYILFEKYLFNDQDYYEEVSILLRDRSIKAWVNQWMSFEKSFLELSKLCSSKGNIELKVKGKNWGLCSNSAHFINFFDFLTNRKDLVMHSSHFDKEVIESKRNGFFELSGKIIVNNIQGDRLILESTKDKLHNSHPIFLEVTTEKKKIRCKYEEGILEVSVAGLKDKKFFDVALQSSMTLKLLSDILKKDSCSLPDYETSKKHHLVVHRAFTEAFEQRNINTQFLPVT